MLQDLFGTHTAAAIQFIKYSIGGGVATGVHIIFFHLVAWKLFAALQPNDWAVRSFKLTTQELDDDVRARNSMFANGAAFLVSNYVAYLIYIYWIFVPGRHHWVIELGLFYIVSGVSIVLGTSLMGYLIRRFGILTSHAFCSNLLTALLINFVMRKYFIFSG